MITVEKLDTPPEGGTVWERQLIDGGIKGTHMWDGFGSIINFFLLGSSAGYISPSVILPVNNHNYIYISAKSYFISAITLLT